MQSNNYKILGTLPSGIIDWFESEILKKADINKKYQWVRFDDILHNKFLDIFEHPTLKIQFAKTLKGTYPVQKAFVSYPNSGFRIHKDGLQCNSALNIAISCNDKDWIRWYDDDYINSISEIKILNKFDAKSRDVNIFNYEDVQYIDELHVSRGDIYILDVNKYHSFKCIGNNIRIIIQTKFEGYPTFDQLKELISLDNFKNEF